MAIINGTNNGETLLGTADDDTITALAGDDRINGGDGDDFIDGGAGFDTGDYRSRGQAFTFDLTGFTNTAVSDDMTETDTFERVERIFGTNFGDTYNVTTGFDGDDGTFVALRLGAGDDLITNAGAAVRLEFLFAADGVTVDLGAGTAVGTAAGDIANNGSDTFTDVHRVRGSSNDDTLLGSNSGSTFEEFEGWDGADFIDGVGGTNNWVRYSFGPSGATVDLSQNTATDGWGDTDQIFNIQHLRGGSQGDDFTGDDQSNFFRPGAGDDTITGGDGFDTGDYRFDSSSPITFTLSTVVTAVGTSIGTDTYVGVERFKGGSGDDMFMSDLNFVNDISNIDGLGVAFSAFEGRQGDDIIVGNGLNRIEYFGATAGIDADLERGTVIGDSSIGTDTVSNILSIAGSSFDDQLRGTDNPSNNGRFGFEAFHGGEGDDLIDGRGGLDRIDFHLNNNGVGVTADLTAGQITDGFGGVDTFFNIEGIGGTDDDDTLSGDGGDNLLEPNAGDDMVDGRGGVDTVFYDNQLAGVTVDLGVGTADDGEGGTDTLISIENAEGSPFDDTLTGSGDGNLLIGRGGVDMISGAGGDDTLVGGAGADTLDGGAGFDTAEYLFASAGVTVDLAMQTATDGGGATDTLVSIEGAIGSNFDDMFVDAAGVSAFRGGDGVDTLDYSGSATLILANLTAARVTSGGVNDAVSEVENIVGTGLNDTLVGDGEANTLTGGDGADRLDGRGGADMLIGGDGNDIYTVDDVGDTVVEQANGGDKDRINVYVDFTNPDNNEFLVGKFSDVGLNLIGNAGRDRLAGANKIHSPDTIQGLGSNDFIAGAVGNDDLDGGSGNDRIFGNSGDDTIVGGLGNDRVTGQFGADTFVHTPGDGRDTITDFNETEDLLDLRAHGFGSFGDVQALMSDNGTDTTVDLAGVDRILLQNVLFADIGQEDVLIV